MGNTEAQAQAPANWTGLQIALVLLVLALLPLLRFWRFREEQPNAPFLHLLGVALFMNNAPENANHSVQVKSEDDILTALQLHNIAPEPVAPARSNWFEDLAYCRDMVHLLVVGATGSGKTYFVRALMFARKLWAGHDLLVIDPHQERTHACPNGDWPVGIEVIGAGRDWPAINAKLTELLAEADYRFKMRADIDKLNDWKPCTIVIDEWAAIIKNCPDAAAFMKMFARETRKIEMNIVLLVQDKNVKTILGEYGEGAVRENFDFLILGNMARVELPEVRWVRGQRPGVLVHLKQPKPVLLNFVPTLLNKAENDPAITRKMSVPQYIVSDEVKSQLAFTEGADFEKNTSTSTSTSWTEITEVHLKTAAYMVHFYNTSGRFPSDRELAKWLWPGKGNQGGSYAVKAKAIKQAVLDSVTGVTGVTEGVTDSEDEDGTASKLAIVK